MAGILFASVAKNSRPLITEYLSNNQSGLGTVAFDLEQRFIFPWVFAAYAVSTHRVNSAPVLEPQ